MNTSSHYLSHPRTCLSRRATGLRQVLLLTPRNPSSSDSVLQLKQILAAIDAKLISRRSGLLAFLSLTYEFANHFGLRIEVLKMLREEVARLYSTKRQQKLVAKMGIIKLLLIASMGTAPRSSQSKYNRILDRAFAAAIPTNRELFRAWLNRSKLLEKGHKP